jgi:hypothetical protein
VFGYLSNCVNYGSVTAIQNAGGIAGQYGELADETVTAIQEYLVDYYANYIGGGEEEVVLEDEATADPYIGYSYNFGSIFAKENAGGIAGYISADGVESRMLEVCGNEGNITAVNSDGGGIAGQMLNSTISDCFSSAIINGNNAEYIGGIVGRMSFGEVKYCFALGEVYGIDYVGGIAGLGHTLLNNYSYIEVYATGESIGAIAGNIGEEADYNYFVYINREGIGGIDATNYRLKAKELTVEQLSSQGTLSESLASFDATHWQVAADKITFPAITLFYNSTSDVVGELLAEKMNYYSAYSFYVDFVGEDGVIATIRVDYGNEIPADQIPAVPTKDGYYIVWEDFSLINVTGNITISAIYTKGVTSISSGGSQPTVIIEGIYYPETVVSLTESDAEFATLAIGNEETINVKILNHYFIYKIYTVDIVYDGQSVAYDEIKVKLKIPDDVANAKIAVVTESGLVIVDCTQVGSYLSVDLNGYNQFILLSQNMHLYNYWWFYVIILIVVLFIAFVIFMVVKKEIRAKFKKQLATTLHRRLEVYYQHEAEMKTPKTLDGEVEEFIDYEKQEKEIEKQLDEELKAEKLGEQLDSNEKQEIAEGEPKN